MKTDDLGDRMKLYEGIEQDRRFMPQLPILARIDGRCFSKFTKGLKRPYDKGMSDLMIQTAKYLAAKTKCKFSDDQISGLGFTAARGDSVTVVVDGRRSYNIGF